MSLASTVSAQVTGRISATIYQTGDLTANFQITDEEVDNFAATGGAEPIADGILTTGSDLSFVAATDYLLAAATAPFGSYNAGFAPAGKKPKALKVENVGTVSVTLKKKTSGGLPLLDGVTDGIPIPAGGFVLFSWPDGLVALATTSNDGITVTPASGTGKLRITMIYGPANA